MLLKCKEQNYDKYASYKLQNVKPMYCKKHKKENIIDINHTKCKENNCNKRPSYNLQMKKL